MDNKSIATGITVNQLSSQKSELLDRAVAAQVELRRAVSECNFELGDRLYDGLKRYLQAHQTLKELQQRLEASDGETPIFVIGSKLLHDAFRQLIAIPTESILYASGYHYGRFRTVEELLPLDLEVSNHGYAKGTDESIGRILIALEKYGAYFTAYFHAHPGKGTQANNPSRTDITNHARLEQGHHKTVGGIFSRDGYVRFFSDRMSFEIAVIGKEVEHVAQNQFRLTKV